MWIKPPADRRFTVDDLFTQISGEFFTFERYLVVSPLETLISLFYLSLGYGILAWYFDNVISSNRGVP